jgi:hypothetical protein
MILSKKELADMCNMPTNALAVYIRRNQIHVENDVIDSAHPINVRFIAKKQQKKPNPVAKEKKPKPLPLETQPKPQPKQPTPSLPTASIEPELSEDEPNSLLEIEKEMQKAKLRRQINGDTKEKIIIQKLMGELVEVSVVEQLVMEVGKSIVIEFRAVLDSFVNQIAFKHEIDNVEVSGYRKHGIFVINKAYDDAIEVAKKKLDEIVADLNGQ